MRIHVALGPAEYAAAPLEDRAVLVVDVIRASTTVVAACAAGCRRILPVRDRETAVARKRALEGVGALLGGERNGETIAGFDLGNSPLEYTEERVSGRTVVLTTSNGTAAMLEAGRAAVAAVAALTNVEAAARWAGDRGLDLTVLCAGEAGQVSLEDVVCAGLIVDVLAGSGVAVEATDAATTARRAAGFYAERLPRLAEDSRWARRLVERGRGADVAACLRRAGLGHVPEIRAGAIVLDGDPAERARRPGRIGAAEASA
jgi:2-phosphosulfolactate phosphatase